MHVETLNTFTYKIVQELRMSSERSAADSAGKGRPSYVAWEDLEARKSFVGLFLEDAQKRGEELSDEHLRDLVMNFLLAGRDPTAQALSWTIFCLCQNPEVGAKARQEIYHVCGDKDPEFEDINRFPYLTAVLNEALRLYPSVPVDAKVTGEDDTWPDGTFVPAGSMVLYDIWSLGRDQNIWGKDAEDFRPERWLERKDQPTMYEYAVFNAGPRECLGRRLALVEMKAALAMLLPSISFKLAVPADQITPDAQLTLGMGRGLPCFVDSESARARAGSNVSTSAHSDDKSACSEESMLLSRFCSEESMQ